MTSKFLTVLVAYCLIGLTNNAFAQSNQLTTIELKIGIYRIEAELADTSVARQTGLMYRSFLPTNSGMLFVIEEKGIHCFFMRNTKVALSIAFIDDDGKIVNIADMEPETLNNHCPRSPVRFALEMNQKWFAQRAIGPGAVIQGLPKK
jgi:uncharacterized membrane protein (UPF0127 family)